MAYHALMRVISVNVCGIRSAAAKGLFRWLRRQNADFICLQETRSHEDQLAEHDVQLPGYLPEERAWMDRLFGAGYVDAFREVRPEPGLYTWWSNRGQARAKNVGWRIDYQVVSADLAGRARAATIYKERRFSDHAPLVMDYEL